MMLQDGLGIRRIWVDRMFEPGLHNMIEKDLRLGVNGTVIIYTYIHESVHLSVSQRVAGGCSGDGLGAICLAREAIYARTMGTGRTKTSGELHLQ